MPDYQQSKIYRIVCNITGKAYYGSTTKKHLSQRLSGHVSHYKSYLKDHENYTTSFIIIEQSNYEIFLVELFPCNSKDELRARERFYIENNVCVNKCIPMRTTEEYRIDKKDYFKQKNYEYREKNKDEISRKRLANKDVLKQKNREYREANKEEIKRKKQIYRDANKAKLYQSKKEAYDANKDEINRKRREAYKAYDANRDEINRKRREANRLKKQSK